MNKMTHVLLNQGNALHLIDFPADDWYGRTKCGLLYSGSEPTDRYRGGRGLRVRWWVMHVGFVEFGFNPVDAAHRGLCKNCQRAKP